MLHGGGLYSAVWHGTAEMPTGVGGGSTAEGCPPMGGPRDAWPQLLKSWTALI